MLKLRDIVDRDVVSVGPDMFVADAARLLTQYRVELAPVVQSGKVVGLLTREALLGSMNHRPIRIRELTYGPYHALPPDTDLPHALAFARQSSAEHILVLDQGRLVGIVPTVRILSSLGEN